MDKRLMKFIIPVAVIAAIFVIRAIVNSFIATADLSALEQQRLEEKAENQSVNPDGPRKADGTVETVDDKQYEFIGDTTSKPIGMGFEQNYPETEEYVKNDEESVLIDKSTLYFDSISSGTTASVSGNSVSGNSISGNSVSGNEIFNDAGVSGNGVETEFIESEQESTKTYEIAYNDLYENPSNGFIYVGDSRYVGMSGSANVNVISPEFVIARKEMGLEWLMNTAAYEVVETVQEHTEIENWYINFGLGVNDLNNIAGYIDYYTQFQAYLEELTDGHVWFTYTSVNPTNGSEAGLNQLIEQFNQQIQQSFPEQYIDTYTFLKDTGFATSDGVHYNNETYNKTLLFIRSKQ